MKKILIGVSAFAITVAMAGCAPAENSAEGSTDQPEGLSAEFSEEVAALIPEHVRDRGHLIWTAAPRPPFYISDDAGQFTGMGPDLEAAAEAIMGIDIEFNSAEGVDAFLLSIQSGRADYIVGGVRATPEHQEDFDVVVWQTTGPAYMFNADRADEIETTDDLCGLAVAFREGSAMEAFIDELDEACAESGAAAIDKLSLPGDGSLLAIQSGRADVQAGSLDALLYQQLQMDEPDDVMVITQDTASPDYAGGLATAGSGVGELMFAVMQEMVDQGVYQELLQQWNMEATMLDEPLFNPF